LQHRGAAYPVAPCKRETAEGQDPDAKAFATATLPAVLSHLKKSQSIARAARITQKQPLDGQRKHDMSMRRSWRVMTGNALCIERLTV
jgi:hypothetical protein